MTSRGKSTIFHQDGHLEFDVAGGEILVFRRRAEDILMLSIHAGTQRRGEIDFSPPLLRLGNVPIAASRVADIVSPDLHLPEPCDAAGRQLVNLYYDAHFMPVDSRIAIRRRGKVLHVAWTCTCEDINYYNAEARPNDVRAEAILTEVGFPSKPLDVFFEDDDPRTA